MMQTLLLYGSTHGTTRRIVEKLPSYLNFAFDVCDVRTVTDQEIVTPYQLLLFFSPTYGDGELQEDMERLFFRHTLPISGKYYAICELGNYYGYDDFTYGALPIIEKHLCDGGAKPLIAPLSLDSLPKKDWENLAKWCSLLNDAYDRHA